MMKYTVNGQVTVGNIKFWRIDNYELMEKEDYNAITFLQNPTMLLNVNQFSTDQVKEFLQKLNKE